MEDEINNNTNDTNDKNENAHIGRRHNSTEEVLHNYDEVAPLSEDDSINTAHLLEVVHVVKKEQSEESNEQRLQQQQTHQTDNEQGTTVFEAESNSLDKEQVLPAVVASTISSSTTTSSTTATPTTTTAAAAFAYIGDVDETIITTATVQHEKQPTTAPVTAGSSQVEYITDSNKEIVVGSTTSLENVLSKDNTKNDDNSNTNDQKGDLEACINKEEIVAAENTQINTANSYSTTATNEMIAEQTVDDVTTPIATTPALMIVKNTTATGAKDETDPNKSPSDVVKRITQPFNLEDTKYNLSFLDDNNNNNKIKNDSLPKNQVGESQIAPLEATIKEVEESQIAPLEATNKEVEESQIAPLEATNKEEVTDVKAEDDEAGFTGKNRTTSSTTTTKSGGTATVMGKLWSRFRKNSSDDTPPPPPQQKEQEKRKETVPDHFANVDETNEDEIAPPPSINNIEDASHDVVVDLQPSSESIHNNSTLIVNQNDVEISISETNTTSTHSQNKSVLESEDGSNNVGIAPLPTKSLDVKETVTANIKSDITAGNPLDNVEPNTSSSNNPDDIVPLDNVKPNTSSSNNPDDLVLEEILGDEGQSLKVVNTNTISSPTQFVSTGRVKEKIATPTKPKKLYSNNPSSIKIVSKPILNNPMTLNKKDTAPSTALTKTTTGRTKYTPLPRVATMYKNNNNKSQEKSSPRHTQNKRMEGVFQSPYVFRRDGSFVYVTDRSIYDTSYATDAILLSSSASTPPKKNLSLFQTRSPNDVRVASTTSTAFIHSVNDTTITSNNNNEDDPAIVPKNLHETSFS